MPRGKNPNSKATQFQPGNPGGVISITTRARRAYRTAFDVLLDSDKPAAEAIKSNPKDTLAQRLAKDTLRDALMGEPTQQANARKQVMDLFANRPAQGVYASDEDGKPVGPPENLGEVLARLTGLGVTLPPGLVPRTDDKEKA